MTSLCMISYDIAIIGDTSLVKHAGYIYHQAKSFQLILFVNICALVHIYTSIKIL